MTAPHAAALAKIAELRAQDHSRYPWRYEGAVNGSVAFPDLLGPLLDVAESFLKVWHAPGAPLESGAPRCLGEHSVIVQAWPCLEAAAVLRALGVEEGA